MTLHHCLPRYRFGKKGNNKYTLFLCRRCHDTLHELIAEKEKHRKLSMMEYMLIAVRFLEDTKTAPS